MPAFPFFKSIYVSVKQVSDTLFSSSGQAFRKALLVQYPRNGSWTIAFQTGTPGGDVVNHLHGEYVSVYVPTTPNPTSGFFLMMPKSDVVELDMTVDEALKYVISMGVAAPGPPRRAPGAWSRPSAPSRTAAARPPAAHPSSPLFRPPSLCFMRTDYCGLIDTRFLGQTVTLFGWVHRRRDHGGVIFIDLRDREGLVQVVVDPDTPDTFAVADRLRSEYVVKVEGRVRPRPEGTVNPNLASGAIEVLAKDIELLNASLTPPFQLDEENLSENVRLEYRVIDLRRPEMQRNLRLRYQVAMAVRRHLDAQGFIDIETPMLTKSTPEGARDFLVPSRMHAGQFYALPQSPQLFKQLLMIAGFDRYYQITKCFRDEDLRADRQPEFTQIDVETSFLGVAEITGLMETMIRSVFKEVMGIELANPFPRMSYAEAMSKYGSDKPDLRVPLTLTELTDVMRRRGVQGVQQRGQRCRGPRGGACAFPAAARSHAARSTAMASSWASMAPRGWPTSR